MWNRNNNIIYYDNDIIYYDNDIIYHDYDIIYYDNDIIYYDNDIIFTYSSWSHVHYITIIDEKSIFNEKNREPSRA